MAVQSRTGRNPARARALHASVTKALATANTTTARPIEPRIESTEITGRWAPRPRRVPSAAPPKANVTPSNATLASHMRTATVSAWTEMAPRPSDTSATKFMRLSPDRRLARCTGMPVKPTLDLSTQDA